ncbi:MAG: metallophosphoesterase [Clostridia bacterium]|nr:metallophosphoesterase [Clostridia bacterium]
MEELRFRDGKFRIMLVGDPHGSAEDRTRVERDKLHDYQLLQDTAVERLRPDLVVYMGDNASGDTEEELHGALRVVMAAAEKRGVPTATVVGNHDLQKKISDMDVYTALVNRYDRSYFRRGDYCSEYGDYCVILRGEDGAPVMTLWFMYSGDKAPVGFPMGYGFVTKEQIEWYEKTAARIAETNGSKPLPAMVFQHIPVVEEYALLKEISCLSLLTNAVKGDGSRKGKYYVLNRETGVTGYLGEAPCVPEYNSGQFESWKRTGDVFAAFFGHDHMNDFVGRVDGILLGQCKAAGFRIYGDGVRQGVRVIDVDEKDPGHIKTRMYSFRELCGIDNCRSVHGLIRHFPDRITTKVDMAFKVTPFITAGGCIATVGTFLLLTRERKK